MTESAHNSDIERLASRIRQLERSLAAMACLFLVLCCIGAGTMLRQKAIEAASPETLSPATLRLHKLVIVDEAGKERIVIAAPIPDPVVDGRVSKRRITVGAGIQFKEPDGTERGGIASEDDGSFMFGIDDRSGHERAHLYFIPDRGAGVFLQSTKGSESLSLLNPADGSKEPTIEVVDQAGKTVRRFTPGR